VTEDVQAVETAIRAGDKGKARFLLRPLLTNPTADVLFLSAQVAATPDQAKQQLRKALELDPAHGKARDELDRLENVRAKVILPSGKTVDAEKVPGFSMAKPTGRPDLAPIPASIFLRTYRPSGKLAPLAIVLLVIGGPLLGIAVGLLMHAVGTVIIVPPAVFLANGVRDVLALQPPRPFSMLVAAFYVLVGIFYAGLFFFGVFAALLGFTVWLLAKLSKCRSHVWVRNAALLSATFAYGMFIYKALQSDGIVQSLLDAGFSMGLLVTGCVLAGLWFFNAAINIPSTRVQMTPFSELHGKWYPGKWRDVKIDVNALAQITDALDTGSVEHIRKIVRMRAGDLPYLYLRMRGCSQCDQCDYQVKATLYWKEVSVYFRVRRLREETSIVFRKESLFNIMIPAELAHLLDASLFS
jgi:hypothetical protein